MNEWQNAYYLILAKQGIDSLLFLQKYYDDLVFHEDFIRNYRLPLFYLSLCYILEDKYKEGKKKEICESNKTIQQIFMKRDKNYAHKDANFKQENLELNDLIKTMKQELEEVYNTCKDKLPQNLKLEYVPHDRMLFRILYPLSYIKDIEDYCNHPIFYISDEDKDVNELIKMNTSDARKTSDDMEEIGFHPVEGITRNEQYQDMELKAIKWEIEFESKGLFYENMYNSFMNSGGDTNED